MIAGILLRTPALLALAFGVSVGFFSIFSYLIRSDTNVNSDVSEPVRFDFIRLPEKGADLSEPSVDLPPPPSPSAPPPKPDLSLDLADAQATGFSFNTDYNLGNLTRFDGLSGDLSASREAVPILRVSPLYPPRASSRGLEGWVEIGFTISTSGATKDVSVLNEEPAGVFGRAAVKAVRKWKYKPQKVDGQVQERTGQKVIIQFRLDES